MAEQQQQQHQQHQQLVAQQQEEAAAAAAAAAADSKITAMEEDDDDIDAEVAANTAMMSPSGNTAATEIMTPPREISTKLCVSGFSY